MSGKHTHVSIRRRGRCGASSKRKMNPMFEGTRTGLCAMTEVLQHGSPDTTTHAWRGDTLHQIDLDRWSIKEGDTERQHR